MAGALGSAAATQETGDTQTGVWTIIMDNRTQGGKWVQKNKMARKDNLELKDIRYEG